MQKLTLGFVLSAIFVLVGCSAEVPDGEVRVPESSSSLEGEQADAVVALFEDAGFVNVESRALGDLVTGWLKDPGEVKEVAIGGEASFSSGDTFPAEVAVVVFYHSFPEDDPEEPAGSPKPTAEPSPGDEVLTVDSSPEFASLLVLPDYCDEEVAAFARTYQGRAVNFDGNIGALSNSEGNSTRYNILVGAGDYSETSQSGPAFQFRDVNITSDLGLTGSNIPDSLEIGDNITVTAEIVSYEESSCLFLLDPISTQFR